MTINKKVYLEPTLRVVYIPVHCELMDGSAPKTSDEEVDDDDEFLGTRPFEFDWD